MNPHIFLALAACLAGCRDRHVAVAGTPPRAPHRASRRAPDPAPAGATPLAVVDAGVTGDARGWPFVEHARQWCLPDRLARTDYLLKWFPQFHGTIAEGDPVPEPYRFLPGLRAGTHDPVPMEDQQRLLTWQEFPRRSHVMDCAFPVPIEAQGDGATRTTTYTIYLPADYLDHPERPRPILVLVSGGNGNRTRWFLTPLNDQGVIPGTGGLEVRRRTDAWAAAHPGKAAPIVVGLDGSSAQYPNGMWAYLEHELIDHLLATYLPGHPRARIPYGVESISSGTVEVVHALRVNPNAFHTVGFLSPYVHPNGVDMRWSFGTRDARTALFRALARRHAEGTFAMRFSVGNIDDHCPRAFEFHQALAAEGVFPTVAQPAFERCNDPDATHGGWQCVTVWPGFYRYPGVAHHYRALLPSFPPQFDWELDTLSEMLDRLGNAPSSPDAGVACAGR